MVTLSPNAGQWPRRTLAWSLRPATNSSTSRDFPTPAEPSTLTRWQAPSAAARSNRCWSSCCSRPRPTMGAIGRRARPGRSGRTSRSRQTFCGSAAPLTVSGPAGSALTASVDQPVGLLAEQDLAGPGQLLEPLGQVDGRAGELLLEGAGVAHQHVAGVDAEADVELQAALLAHLLGQLVQGGAELAGSPHGPQGVVLVQLGDAEGGHEAVAVAFADAGPPVAEGPADGLAVAVEEPLHRERVELALQLGRLDHVAEDHRDDPELLGGGPGREPVAALGAEPGLVDQAVAAVRASRHASEYMDEQALEPSCW